MWSAKSRENSLNSWKNNRKRRKDASSRLKKTWKDNEEKMKEKAKENSFLGGIKSAEKWKNDPTWAEKRRNESSKRMKGKNNPMFGKKLSKEHLMKLSPKGKIWITDKNENKLVYPEEAKEYYLIGFIKGRNLKRGGQE